MNQERVQSAIANLLQRLKNQYGDDPESLVMVGAPICSLDQESYDLLRLRTGGTGYPRFFNRAVHAIKPIIAIDQLTQVIAAVKKNRSHYRSKTVHTRMGKLECKWVEDMAKTMQVKPSRIMEAALFLYLRSEDQGSGGEN